MNPPEAAILWASVAPFVPLINGGILVGLVGLVARYRIENRKLSIGENAGIRAEFIAEMGSLREEVKGLREENAMLRREVGELNSIITGQKRSETAAMVSAQRVVADALPNSSDMIRDAAQRSDDIHHRG